MTEPGALRRRILVVEDEYVIAMDLALELEELGFEVVGPAGSVSEALALVDRGDRLDGAILDVNLRNERVYPVADALAARGVRFVFASGYDARLMPDAYADVPRCGKPIDRAVIVRFLGREAPAG
ncbi:MAG: response regulator [Alphaproteobacteria bacterium]|nr:MAG: response regulator [Alphaproteobacteria bacterium]